MRFSARKSEAGKTKKIANLPKRPACQNCIRIIGGPNQTMDDRRLKVVVEDGGLKIAMSKAAAMRIAAGKDRIAELSRTIFLKIRKRKIAKPP